MSFYQYLLYLSSCYQFACLVPRRVRLQIAVNMALLTVRPADSWQRLVATTTLHPLDPVTKVPVMCRRSLLSLESGDSQEIPPLLSVTRYVSYRRNPEAVADIVGDYAGNFDGASQKPSS